MICDEPVSALDLSIQAQVLNLLSEIQSEFELSFLFVAHDLAVVYHVSHRIVVVYRGQIMEQGTADEVYHRPAHPYTRALLEASPCPIPANSASGFESRSRAPGAWPTPRPTCEAASFSRVVLTPSTSVTK